MKMCLALSLCVIALLAMGQLTAYGQISVSGLRSSLESSNLEVVTLEGVARLTGRQQQELGGRCGGAGFVLTDDTSSIEVSIRRANRLLQPVRKGDRIHVTEQIRVFRTRDNVPYRICIEATEIEHVHP